MAKRDKPTSINRDKFLNNLQDSYQLPEQGLQPYDNSNPEAKYTKPGQPEFLRANEISMKGDTSPNIRISLEDHDETILYYLKNNIKPTVEINGNKREVPVIYGSPERWKSIQKDGFYRDKNGKIQTPIIILKRESFEKNRSIGNKLDGNKVNNVQYFKKGYSQRNSYDNFSVLQNQVPSQEYQVGIIPDYITITYKLTIFTDYVEHMNQLIEAIEFASDSYWGDKERFMFRANITNFPTPIIVENGDDRASRSDLTLTVQGYIIPNTVNVNNAAPSPKSFNVTKILFKEFFDESQSVQRNVPAGSKRINIYNPQSPQNKSIPTIYYGIFSGSFIGDGSQLTNLPTSSIDTSSLVTTSSFFLFTSSYYSDSSSFDYRINNITIDTSSLVTTSSFNNFTTFYNTGSFRGDISGTASYSTNNLSSSFAVSSSFTQISISSSYAQSASQALTASFVPNYVLNSATSSMLQPYVLNSATSSMLQPYVLTSYTSSMSVATSSFSLGGSGSFSGSFSGSGANLFNLPTASATVEGIVTTGSQIIGGAKTFIEGITTNGVTITNLGSTNSNIAVINNDVYYTVESGSTHYFGGTPGNIANNVSIPFGTFSILQQTGSTIASFDANKNIVSLPLATYPSLTELKTVKGITTGSSIQSQLNNKQDTLTETNFGAFMNGLTAKDTLVDADEVVSDDSADSNKSKKTSWLNVWDNYIKPKVNTLISLATSNTVNKLIIATPSANINATSPTMVYSQLIPANTLPSSCVLDIDYRLVKKGVAGSWPSSISINTSNSLSGATVLSTIAPSQSALIIRLQRTFNINSGTIKGASFITNNIGYSDATTSTVAESSASINVANDIYILVSVLPGSSADTINGRHLRISW